MSRRSDSSARASRSAALRREHGTFLDPLLDRLEPWALWAAARRSTGPIVVATVAVIAAVCIVAGLVLFGRDGVHEPFRDLGPASLLTSLIMLCCAALGAIIARRESGGDWRRGDNFWFLAALGFLFLSIEAPLDIHGRLGGLVDEWIGMPPAVNHWSDLVLGGYMLAGLALVATHRREVLRDRRALAYLATGAGLSVVMLGVDGGTAQRPWHQVVEETIELFAAAALFLAFIERFRFSLRLSEPPPG
jgi:hypothetical protein